MAPFFVLKNKVAVLRQWSDAGVFRYLYDAAPSFVHPLPGKCGDVAWPLAGEHVEPDGARLWLLGY